MIGALLTLVYDEFRRILYYRWTVIGVVALIFCGGAVYVAKMPNVYDAWAQIFVNKQTPLAAAAQGVSLGSENAGTYVVQKTLLNDQSLENVVRQTNPAAKTMSTIGMALAVNSLRSHIHVPVDQDDGFVEFHYMDKDALHARDVVQALLGQFISDNVDRNRKDLSDAEKFLDAQIAQYQTMMTDSQSKLNAFRQQHAGLTSTGTTPALSEADIASLTSVDDAPPPPPVAAAPPPPVEVPAAKDVARLQAQLDSLHTQYTDEYPDVIATKRQLDKALAEQTREQALAAAAPPAPAAPTAVARPRMVHVRRAAVAAPEVQAQWSDMVRADEVLRVNYQQLVTRREAARMSQAAYGSDGSGKFQITRTPTVPTFPTGPNRPLLLALAFVAALIGGVAAAYLRAAIAGIFVSPRELENAFQIPVVGTVSWEPAWNTGRRKRSNRDKRRDHGQQSNHNVKSLTAGTVQQ